LTTIEVDWDQRLYPILQLNIQWRKTERMRHLVWNIRILIWAILPQQQLKQKKDTRKEKDNQWK
jgi:hypothetical protein